MPYAVRPTPGELSRFADPGIEEVACQLPSAGEADVPRTLDEYAEYL